MEDEEFNLADFAVPATLLLPHATEPEPKPVDDKPLTDPFIKHIPIRWWLRVVKLHKEHPQADILNLAMAILYLHGLKYQKGLDTDCLKKFGLARRTSRRNLNLLENAGLVVVERAVCRNRPPTVTPLFTRTERGGEHENDD